MPTGGLPRKALSEITYLCHFLFPSRKVMSCAQLKPHVTFASRDGCGRTWCWGSTATRLRQHQMQCNGGCPFCSLQEKVELLSPTSMAWLVSRQTSQGRQLGCWGRLACSFFLPNLDSEPYLSAEIGCVLSARQERAKMLDLERMSRITTSECVFVAKQISPYN